ncbi:MAG: type II toxin-antitoxin system RelE/ParE family toxin [Alphaproteobacteria bacterium]|nr:type II toxin-antitoxin system RelE/ParE family toxin [Alphaproteobacteria bacterium]
MKPVVPLERAVDDIKAATDRYLVEADVDVAMRFVDAIETAFGQIGEHPGSGSTRWAFRLDLPGLRSWALRGFPYVVFYMEREAQVDVWRVLHERRSVETALGQR